MKIPFWKIKPHIGTILTSIGFEPDYGSEYAQEKAYLRALRDGETRRWMDEKAALSLLRVISRSISKVSGYDYRLSNSDKEEAIRSQALLPLNAAYNMLAQRR